MDDSRPTAEKFCKEVSLLKKRLAIILSLAGIMICACICVFGLKMTEEKGYSFVTALSIDDIAEKMQEEDGFYLTVALPEHVRNEYSLSYEKLTIQTSKDIFEQVKANEGFVGATLQVTIPEGRPEKEIGIVLKEKLAEYCRIISVTTKENVVIQ